MTATQVARLHRSSRRTVLAAIARGDLPAVRDGWAWRIREEDAKAWTPPRAGRPKGRKQPRSEAMRQLDERILKLVGASPSGLITRAIAEHMDVGNGRAFAALSRLRAQGLVVMEGVCPKWWRLAQPAPVVGHAGRLPTCQFPAR